MSWLTTLVSQHEELESPTSFWYWAAIASISAVVKDQIWLDRAGIYNLYPNIYVLLHAESGLKKGPPISMAKQLVRKVNNTHVIGGRSSIQGILKKLGTATSLPGGKIEIKSTAFICSSELSSSIVEDKVATTILTDLYDRQYNKGEWESLLKMESFQLKNPTITMLTATNESLGEDFFTKKDVQGGYFARTFIIHETTRHRINSLIDNLKNPPNYESSSDYLKELSKLKGAFATLSGTEAGRFYDEWYHGFMRSMDDAEIKDATGTLNRFGDSVLKVAMLLSLAEEPKLVISESAIREAVINCEKLIGNVRKTTMTRGAKDRLADQKAILVNLLVKNETHSISRERLMKNYLYHFSARELDEIVTALEQAGLVRTELRGSSLIYTMPLHEAERIARYLKGRDK